MQRNPTYPYAQRDLKDACSESHRLPAMVEIINHKLHFFHCKDGKFDWYPVNFEELYGLLWQRAYSTKGE